MQFRMKATMLAVATAFALSAGTAYGAANTGGFATADGNISSARKFTAATFEEINTIIANARTTTPARRWPRAPIRCTSSTPATKTR